MNARLRLSILLPFLLPFLALALQWVLWPWIAPFVWFLFFPIVFFSARLGGFRGGLASTVLSAGIVWFFFMSPQLSWTKQNPSNLYSVGLFLVMGYLLSDAQERLRRAQQNTEAALTETRVANEKITQLYQKTLELDEFKSQFFANVSHELRTPLSLILAPLERRFRRPSSADFSEAEHHETEIMLRNARLLYRHVTDLLDVAKLEAGRMTLAWAQLDLARLVRMMASHFELLATERHIDYTVTVPDALPIEADVEKLQRVLLNLLSNAFKFTPDNGAVALRLSEEDGHALIEVQDNGPGVPAALREAVFERFRQGKGDARRRHGGTGLGLFIVKDFVELHGGTVVLGEAPGGGALFSVRLPLAAPAGTELGASAPLDEVITRQAIEELGVRASAVTLGEVQAAGTDAPLVLVVEDNADMNAFVADTLRPHYRVACAFDGHEGLEQALALQPDLILSDVMMPGMSGDEMVVALRREPRMENVPIVMLTAKADDELRVRMLKEGVQGYLNKPFLVEELLARVNGLIKERRSTADKLRESETRFEATFEQAAVGIAIVALDGHWLRVNRKLCEIVGYSQEELLTKTFQDITHPDDQKTDLHQVRRMLAGEIQTYSMEKRYIRKDGSLVWINLTVALAWKPDATPDYFISVIEDIQVRKQAEAALKDSESSLKEAQRLAGIGNWVWDIRTDAHTWSEEIYRIYGRDPALPPAIYPEVQQYFTPESWMHLAAAVEKSMAGGVPYECDAEVVRPDGTHRWIVACGEAIRDADRNIISLHGTVQDITERKLAKEKLDESYKELQKLSTHLEVVREEEQKRIARELHDEMGGVLAALNVKVSLMATHPPTEMADLMTEVDILANLVASGIQSLRRIVTELRPSLLDEVGLKLAIERYVQDFERNTEIKCDLRLPEEELTLDGNQSTTIFRIIQESLTNVAKHAKATWVSIVLSEWDTSLMLTVRDNGKGFDLNTQKAKSFGLLAIRERAAMVGGKAEITSAAGKGTTVRVSLPKSPDQSVKQDERRFDDLVGVAKGR